MGSLFQELKRRKVFRVAVAYAVVAWVLIQISGEVLPALQMPQWTVSFVTVLLLLGFPVALLLGWAFELTPDGVKADTGNSSSTGTTQHSDRKLIYATFVLVLLVAGFQIADRFILGSTGSATLVSQAAYSSGDRFTILSSINVGQQADVRMGTTLAPAISPDGTRIAYIQFKDDGPHLYLRELNQLIPRDLVRLTNEVLTSPLTPFFSPDSQQIAYHDAGNLMKISVRGDTPQILATGLMESGIAWESNQSILYSDGNDHSLRRIAAVGGEPQRLQLETASEEQQLVPHVLPGGRAILYNEAAGRVVSGGIILATLDSGEIRTLIERAYAGRYAASGHIVFMRASTLWAVPFDLDRLEITGTEVPVTQGIESYPQLGMANYSFSGDGRLVYYPSRNISGGSLRTELVWMYRDGREEPLDLEPNQYAHPQISPNGEFISLTIPDGNGNRDVWIQDLRQGVLSRRTFSGSGERAIWTPDGENLLFGKRGRDSGVWMVSTSGTGEAKGLIREGDLTLAEILFPDGEKFIYRKGVGAPQLYVSALDGERTGRPLFTSGAAASGADISPDGRWVAYHGYESGQWEVYVRPYPDVEQAKWQISVDGGQQPKWGPEGNELIYLSGSAPAFEVRAVSIDTEDVFTSGVATHLFTGDFAGSGAFGGGTNSYDVSPDGQRLLMNKNIRPVVENRELEELSLVMVDNWFEELKRLAPPDPQ